MNNLIIIPARLNSTRFPNKLLANYKGIPLIEYSIQLARSTGYDVILASENEELKPFAEKNKILFFYMKPGEARCGTERANAVYKAYSFYDNYITLPADEPEIDPIELKEWMRKLHPEHITTAYCDFFCDEDLFSHNSCKIVMNCNREVLYFSRAVIPSSKDGNPHARSFYKKHVGIFNFPNSVLHKRGKYMWACSADLDELEGLEQNRFLQLGLTVNGIKIRHYGFGIDSPEQLIEMEKRFASTTRYTK